MTLKNRTLTELRRLATTNPTAPSHLVLEDGPDRIQLELAQVGPVGCAFEQLIYSTPDLAQASMDQLKAIAENLEQRLGYLLEAIQPIEVDEDACVVQMRSNPPAQDDDGTKYYELVVQRGEIRLRRYSKIKGQPRTPVPAEVTHEVVGRLVDDFVAAV